MNNDHILRLTALRDELAEIKVPKYPDSFWHLINSWSAKATPIIRRDWPDFFDDFQKVIAEPNPNYIRVVYHNSDFSLSKQEHRRQWKLDNLETIEVQQNILSFLCGLFSLPRTPQLSGKFFLGAMLFSVVLTLIVYLLIGDLAVTGFILFFAILIFTVVGAFQLRQSKLLSQKNFIELIGMVFKQALSLLKRQNQ